MRPAHFIAIGIALSAIVLLYIAGKTVPPAPIHEHKPKAAAGGMPGQAVTAIPASFDSIHAASKRQLTAHALEEINKAEKDLLAFKDSAGMIPAITELANIWQAHGQYLPAAYYHARAAQLENSEKKLTFAGQFFLALMERRDQPAEIHAWEAQQAIDCFKGALAINAANDTTKLALATAYIEGTGETMQGVQILLGITREKPEDIPANLMLGKLAIQSAQYDKAIGRFETVLKQQEKNQEALFFMAEAYKGKGDVKTAVALLEKCKTIVNNPEFSRDIDSYIKSFNNN